MLEMPKDVLRIVEQMATKHADDVMEATDRAYAAVRKLPDYQQLVEALVKNSLRELIYDVRHRIDTRMRRELGEGHTTPKVGKHFPDDVYRAMYDFSVTYNYLIAGHTLGEIRGEELLGIAESAEKQARGKMFEANLCRWLRPLVPDGKTVQESVPEKKLRAQFTKLLTNPAKQVG